MQVYKDGEVYDQPYSDAGIISSIRYWLIEKIALGDCVLLNMTVAIEDREEEECSVKIRSVDGSLFGANRFDIPDDKQVTFEQFPKKSSFDKQRLADECEDEAREERREEDHMDDVDARDNDGFPSDDNLNPL